MQRSLLYVESDDHGGNVRGLMSPNVKLPDDSIDDPDIPADEITYYTPALRAYQKYLWKLRTQNLEKLIDLSAGDDIFYLHLGDMTQGQKYVSDWVTTRIGDQFLIALENQRPILKLPNVKLARFVEGTSSHVFGDGTSGGVVSDQLKLEFPDTDIKAVQHGLIDIRGFVIDYAHHGPGPGSRKWLQGNIASYYLRDRMINDLLHGNNPPQLFLRAHFHAWVKAFWNVSVGSLDHTSMLCILPSMCGLGCYGRQVTKSVPSVTNGALCFEIIDGDVFRTHRWTKTLDIRNREVIK